MKTKNLLLASIAALTVSFSANANTTSFVNNDVQNEKGQTIERTVYDSFNNILTPYQKIEFKYEDDGKIIEKKTMKWDSLENKWVNYELTEYDYTQTPIKVNVKKWNSKKQLYM